MPSSYSASLRLELQFTGENTNTWGDRLNTVISRIDFAVAGIAEIAITGDYTLTSSNAADDEARAAVLKFTGALAGNAVIRCPSVTKKYTVWNATSHALTFTTGAGAIVTIDSGDRADIFCDAAGFYAKGFDGVGLKDYIGSVVVGGGASLPSLAGNAGKWLTNNATIALWGYPTTADLTDWNLRRQEITDDAVALALVL